MGFLDIVKKVLPDRNKRLVNKLFGEVALINELEPQFQELSDEALKDAFQALGKQVRSGEKTLDDVLYPAFAMVRESGKRTLGQRHYDVQLLAGMVIHQGNISEMTTGEGKTLMATAPASLNALTGKSVHIVTVNDYLAKRDAAWMGAIYKLLGLSIGCIQSNMDSEERQAEYACDIVYGTNNEFGFDYLRDNMKSSAKDQVQKDRYMVIIDEVDSILIDEARTPLIIAGPSDNSTENYPIADRIAKRFLADDHAFAEAIRDEKENEVKGRFAEIKFKDHTVYMTDEGLSLAEETVGVGSFFTGSNMEWPHFIEQALRANYMYRLDRDYVVRDGEIVIVDEFTGRLMEGRHWSDGLHQAVMAKEGLHIKEENQTLATITIQNFFRLYDKLAGMTGTAFTEAAEFYEIYKLDVIVIPTNRPLRRIEHPDSIYMTKREKLTAIVQEIQACQKMQRPILVGTASIDYSEVVSKRLKKAGVAHEVLNAKNHEREAQIVAQAGKLGSVTISTNMAGRGTDIVLGGNPKIIMHTELRASGFEEGIVSLVDMIDLFDKCLEMEADKDRFLKRGLTMPMILEQSLKVGRKDTPGSMMVKVLNEAGVDDYDEETLQGWYDTYKKWTADCKAEGDQIKELGGLRVLGTERHEARRIDNQLRGRCGRQGDPGENGFAISLEDQLMVHFAGDWVKKMMTRLGWEDGDALESKMVTRAITKAQKKVEEYNFQVRKNLLEYDEVMDLQRKVIYTQRQKILDGKDLKADILEMARERTIDTVDRCLNQEVSKKVWEWDNLSDWYRNKFGVAWAEESIKTMPESELKAFINDDIDSLIEKRAVLNEEEERKIPSDVERLVLEFASVESGYSGLAPLLQECNNNYGTTINGDTIKDLDTYQLTQYIRKEALESFKKTSQENLENYKRQREQVPDSLDQFLHAFVDPDYDGFFKWYDDKFKRSLVCGIFREFDPESLKEKLCEEAEKSYEKHEEEIGDENARKHERFIMHSVMDAKWKDHLKAMDQLRSGIHMVSHAQVDPKVEFKRRGYQYFQEMLALTKEETLDHILKVEYSEEEHEMDADRDIGMEEWIAQHPDEFQAIMENQQAATLSEEQDAVPVTYKRATPKVGRNEPCPCGSGKKYKHCCMKLKSN